DYTFIGTKNMLFKWGNFISAAGLELTFKINCDALTEEDWDCIARSCVSHLPKFGDVIPVPTGGIPFAKAFEQFKEPSCPRTLVVDDVWTTGQSFGKVLMNRHLFQWVGCVAFARGPVPRNVF